MLNAPSNIARHLLLIGVNYSPEPTGIAPYTTGLAEHLAAQGWRITVVTGMPHYPQWRVAEAYRGAWRRREHLREVEVRRVRHHVPPHQSALGRVLYEATFLAQAVTAAPTARPSCVLGIVPSLSGAVAAATLAGRWRVPFGLLFQDLVARAAAQSGMPGGQVAARPAQSLESWSARRASAVAVVAEPFRDLLVARGVEPSRIRWLPNWTHVNPPTGRSSEVRRAMGWDDGRQIVLHAGNMGFKQGLDTVIEAARMVGSTPTSPRFVLMGDGNERRQLEWKARGLENVQFLDPRPETDFMEMLGAVDVLLLNERPSVMDMSLPSKITSYFCSGRPVLAAVAPQGTTATELRRSGGAYLVPAGDPAGLVRGLQELVSDPAMAQGLVDSAARFALEKLDRSRSLADAEAFAEGLLRYRSDASRPVRGVESGTARPLNRRHRRSAAKGLTVGWA